MADLRAPTPSAAAELATPDMSEIYAFLKSSGSRLIRSLSNLADKKRKELMICLSSPVMKNPMALIERRMQMADDALNSLAEAYAKNLEKKFIALYECSYKLGALNPINVLGRGYAAVRIGDKLVKKTSDVNKDDEITVTVTDGDINCIVR